MAQTTQDTTAYEYTLGTAEDLEQLFPAPRIADPTRLVVHSYADVIAHYTRNSLKADGLGEIEVTVTLDQGNYKVGLAGPYEPGILQQFAARHVQVLGPDAAGKAVTGMMLMKVLGVWNPMEGYPVNGNPRDGNSKWHICPPLGLNVIGQKGLLLMHYPPWAVIQSGTFIDCMTMSRWDAVLKAAGVSDEDRGFYRTIIDVNPIAAPGSGESEYPNDYLPIMAASGFFDGPSDRDYIRSMLDLYLNPPGREDAKYTLPLLVCGSPLYDPQAPGWFRAAYKENMPVDKHGTPTVSVLQSGTFKVRPGSPKETPYLVGNHMIAAGVTGRCTDDPSKMPDIRLYEAQDLVAATFLHLCAEDPNLSPAEAKLQACKRWFGNDDGSGAPNPPDPEDSLTICALAQMDLFFEGSPKPHSEYTFEEARQRCIDAKDGDNPCSGGIAPPPRSW